MDILEKYKNKGVEVETFLAYGKIGMLDNESDLAIAYLNISPYENEVERDYAIYKEDIDKSYAEKELFDIDDSEAFLYGAHILCGYFREKRVTAQALLGNQYKEKPVRVLNPLIVRCSEWLKHQFYDKEERLSFFLDRCDGKKNSDIIKEIQGAMAVQFVRFKNSADDRTRYTLMYEEMKRLFPKSIKSTSAWNECMNNPHKSKVPSIADEYKKYMESETD